jgi:hypothetical protein
VRDGKPAAPQLHPADGGPGPDGADGLDAADARRRGQAQTTIPYKPTKRGGGGTLKLMYWQARCT